MSRYLLLALTLLAGCASSAAVPLQLTRAPKTPPTARVIVDEEFVGTLSQVAARGYPLPVGEHRISVEREGYFPFDALVQADREPVKLVVELTPVPD